MKTLFQAPEMELFSVTDVLCSSVGGGGVLPPATTSAPASTAAPTSTSKAGDNYRDDIF